TTPHPGPGLEARCRHVPQVLDDCWEAAIIGWAIGATPSVPESPFPPRASREPRNAHSGWIPGITSNLPSQSGTVKEKRTDFLPNLAIRREATADGSAVSGKDVWGGFGAGREFGAGNRPAGI